MTRIRAALAFAGVGVSVLVFHAQAPAPQAAYKFIEIVPGVYSASGTGTMNVGSNSAVIVNTDDVLIVDSHISPESERAMLQELKTLETLKPIDFVDVIPGHGEPFKGKERVDWFQAYLRDLWKQGSALYEQKVSAADAAKRIDMTAHKAHYPAITAPGVNVPAVSRMFEVMDGRADR